MSNVVITTAAGIKALSQALGWNDVKGFGCVGDGTTDDTANFQAAIDDSESNGKPLFVSPGNYKITSSLTIESPIIMYGAGPGSYENSGIFLARSKITWAGVASGTMLTLGAGSDVIAALEIRGICFDAASLAGKCIDATCLTKSVLKDLFFYRYTSIGLKLNVLASKNSMFNDCQNLMFYSSTGSNQAIVFTDTSDSNTCHNHFLNTTIIFAGNNPAVVVKGDNNIFTRLFLYRASGSGYGVEIGSSNPSCGNNYFFHIQPSESGVHVTLNSRGNMIFGYDRANDQALPTIDSGSQSLVVVNGQVNVISSILGLTGISKTSVIQTEMSGAILFGAADVSKAVVFDIEQINVDYTISFGALWNTKVWYASKLTTGFTIHVSDAPGGSGQYIDWHAIR